MVLPVVLVTAEQRQRLNIRTCHPCSVGRGSPSYSYILLVPDLHSEAIAYSILFLCADVKSYSQKKWALGCVKLLP